MDHKYNPTAVIEICRCIELVFEAVEQQLASAHPTTPEWSQLADYLPYPVAQLPGELGAWLLTSYTDHYNLRPSNKWSLAALGYKAVVHLTYWPAHRLQPATGPAIDTLLSAVAEHMCIPQLQHPSSPRSTPRNPETGVIHSWQQPQRSTLVFNQWQEYIHVCNETVAQWTLANTSDTQLWLESYLEPMARQVVALTRMRVLLSQRQEKKMSTLRWQQWLDHQLEQFFQVQQPLEFRVDWQRMIYYQRLGLGLGYVYHQQHPLASKDTPLNAMVRSLIPADELRELLRATYSHPPATLYHNPNQHQGTSRDWVIITAWSHLFFARFQFFWVDRYLIPASDMMEWTFAKLTPDGFRRSRPRVTHFMGHWWVWIGEQYFCHCLSVEEAVATWIAVILKSHRGQLETDQSLSDWILSDGHDIKNQQSGGLDPQAVQ
jgi:hypothetical protein